MGIIWLLLQASWGRVAIATLAGVISGGCSARLIATINAALRPEAALSPASGALAFGGLALVVLVSGSLSQFLLVDLAQNSVYELRLRLSRRILAAPLAQLERLGPSRLLAVLTEDIQAISNSVFVIPFLCVDIAIIGGCLIYLGWLSGPVFLTVMVFLIVSVVVVQGLLSRVYGLLDRARAEDDRLYGHFRAITDGTKELKLNAERRQQFFHEDLETSATTTRRYKIRALKLAAATTGSGQLLFFAAVGLLLFGLPQVLPATREVLPAYILTLTYLLGPLSNTIERLPNLTIASVSAAKVKQMGLTLSQQELAPAVPPLRPWQTLELRGVRYTYHRDGDYDFTLGPLDITLQAGEKVFIIGGNGSGKSTLAKLLLGLYVPDGGAIYLDGIPIEEANREWYRQHFSAVFADFYLFERLLGEPERLEATARPYLEKLQLQHKVTVAGGTLSTTALSQGQRKRLALLAAYLEDRPIYLFDEWAADQDPLFRQLFYHQLLAELQRRGKTVIVISHDDHYFHLADRVIKLDYGQIDLAP